jgi:tRNA 2-thiouridine synthesizing protein C
MKNYLFVLRKPPYSGAYVQETLDIILTTAAFDQKVSLLFLDDGVFQLKNQQVPEISGQKNTAAIFKALTIYDVNSIYVEAESLTERGLSILDLCLPAEPLSRTQLAYFISQFTVIFPQ